MSTRRKLPLPKKFHNHKIMDNMEANNLEDLESISDSQISKANENDADSSPILHNYCSKLNIRTYVVQNKIFNTPVEISLSQE